MTRAKRWISLFILMLARAVVPVALVGGLSIVLLNGQAETILTAGAHEAALQSASANGRHGSSVVFGEDATLVETWSEANVSAAELSLSDNEVKLAFEQIVESPAFKRDYVAMAASVGASWDDGQDAVWLVDLTSGLAEVRDEIPASLAAAVAENPAVDLGSFPNPVAGASATAVWLFVASGLALAGLLLVTQRPSLVATTLGMVAPYALVTIGVMRFLARACSDPGCDTQRAMAVVVRQRLEPTMIALVVVGAALWLVFRTPSKEAVAALKGAR